MGYDHRGTTYMEIENEATFRTAVTQDINLFAGAGFSVCANGAIGPLPVGAQLVEALRQQFPETQDYDLDLPELYAFLNSIAPDKLELLIRKWYRVQNFDPRYLALERLAIKNIYTTNVDNLFQLIYENSKSQYLNDLYRDGASLSSRSAINLAQLHGSILDENRSLIFGPLELATAASNDQDRWRLLRQHIASRPTLFWGYALKDAGTLQTIRKSSKSIEVVGDSWIQIRPGSAQGGAVQFFRALGFRTVIAETTELLEYLSSLSATKPAVHIADSNLENIPSSSDVLVRPIEDFLAGAAPNWSDIYSTTLAKTSHYNEIAELIAAGQNTIIAGIPGSGKTTLLMQLAAKVNFDGPKILHSGMTSSEAAMLARQIGAAKALILLDDVANDIDAIRPFAALPGVVLVGADRDYALTSVSSMISRVGIPIVGVTGITQQDFTKLWRSIPNRLRAGRHMADTETAYGATPSIFEFVQANVKHKPLGSRLALHVDDLHETDRNQADALVVTCYLHYCNVPASIDVLWAYFGEDVTDVQYLYKLMGAVGDLLLEYDGEHAVEEQDYFSARSRIASEAVLFQIDRYALRTMLTKFHSAVSSARIPSYYAFKRRAYDSKLFRRAFPDADSGLRLYDDLVDRADDFNTQSYVLQQRALFLNRHGLPKDAFREIDIVRNRQTRTNWTIENSYYSILFAANFAEAAYSDDALEQCKRALRGLMSSSKRDSRKHQHLIDFTKLVIKLAGEIKRDEEIRRNITTAVDEMQNLVNKESWLKAPEYLLRDAKRIQSWY